MKKINSTEMPYNFKVIEHAWIPTRDGTKLSARIWLPEEAENRPVPAILEYIPYRKRDFKRIRDTQMHAYFAGHGYASIRVDLRGSGDSEGVLTDEYLPLELDDGEDVLQWLENQPWCTGRVGMIGISWGGFNGLQMAARRPRQLQAVISVDSTDDRYADDIHYMGGALLRNQLSWASTMLAFNSLPPDPEHVGERWKDMWLDRLENSGLWLKKWMEEQHRNDYWKHGSINENYADVQCPVMAVGGYADGYSNAVYRLMEHLQAPKKGLIGPWAHKYPHQAVPGPSIGFLQESLRWWDYWLKDKETGIMDEPMMRAWMQDYFEPKPYHEEISGRWIAEDQWPSPQVKRTHYDLAPGKVLAETDDRPEHTHPVSVESPLSVGLFSGDWLSTGGPDLPTDQRAEDSGSLVFESNTLEDTMEIHGDVNVNFTLSVDKPAAMVAVRLSDIAPNGKATRVTYGLQNLCHRNSHEHPEPLTPGKKEQIQLKLNDVAYTFKKGHRYRVSVSTVYWPMAWPAPEPVELTIYPEQSNVIMPVRPVDQEIDRHLQPFQEAEMAQEVEPEVMKPSENNWWVKQDMAHEETTVHVLNDMGELYFPDTRLTISQQQEEFFTYVGDRYDSLRGEANTERTIQRDDWSIRTLSHSVLTSDKENFYIHATLDAYEDGQRVFSKTWDEIVPRNLL